jgi:hypothetical protein
MTTKITDQPAPKPGYGTAIVDLVIAEIVERDRLGQLRYGTRLYSGNGRDSLVDAMQEALDLVFYLRHAIAERDNETDATFSRSYCQNSRVGKKDEEFGTVDMKTPPRSHGIEK